MDGNLIGLISCLQEKTENREILQHLREVLNEFNDEDIRERSSWHPYGFAVLRLGTAASYNVRFHIWPPNNRSRQNPDWPVHNHPWSLESRIICGRVRNESYKVTPIAGSSDYRLYEVNYHEDISVLKRTNTYVKCEFIEETTYSLGDCYRVPNQAFHASWVDDDIIAATIVRTTKSSTSNPLVVGREGFDMEYRFTRRHCDSKTLRSLMTAALNELAKG